MLVLRIISFYFALKSYGNSVDQQKKYEKLHGKMGNDFDDLPCLSHSVHCHECVEDYLARNCSHIQTDKQVFIAIDALEIFDLVQIHQQKDGENPELEELAGDLDFDSVPLNVEAVEAFELDVKIGRV